MTTAPEGGEPLVAGPAYAHLEEADAVIKLALEVSLPEPEVYARVQAKALAWGLTPTLTAQRLLLATRAQLAPEW